LRYNYALSDVSDHVCRTPETAPSNPRVSIESRLRTTAIDETDQDTTTLSSPQFQEPDF